MSIEKELTKEELKQIEANLKVPVLKKNKIKYDNEISEIFNNLPLSDQAKKELYDEIMDIYRKNPDSPELKLN